jgi:phage terminase large subunit
MMMTTTLTESEISLPDPFAGLFQPSRYKVYYGGRGGAKSWAISRALILRSLQQKTRILCARELQTSIADSVHRLLSDQILAMNLAPFFEIGRNTIRCAATGSEYLFKGIRHSVQEIKSLEGVDICWIEEAQSVSAESWDIVIPTIRKEASEIWISFNPGEETDPTYQRFILKPPPDAIVQRVSWADNPWFPSTLNAERRYMRSIDIEAYEHIWNGHPRSISEAVIFGKRVTIEPFETPADARFFHGADWGFANDPTALVRSFIQDECLFVDAEAFGYGVEIDETPQLFESIPTARKWPIKADSSRPETISYMQRKGFNVQPADKWPGSVEDGIQHLKAFRRRARSYRSSSTSIITDGTRSDTRSTDTFSAVADSAYGRS